MDRRSFLKHLGLLTVPAIVAPKFIFDLGANKSRYVLILDEWQPFTPQVIGLGASVEGRYRLIGNTVTVDMKTQVSEPNPEWEVVNHIEEIHWTPATGAVRVTYPSENFLLKETSNPTRKGGLQDELGLKCWR